MFELFDRTCAISLPERADRRRELGEALRRAGADFGPRVTVFDAIRPDGPGPFRSTGARGCFLSHLAVLREARDRGLRSVLILEDDVEFTPGLAAATATLAPLLATGDWDFVYGGHQVYDRSAAEAPAAAPGWRRAPADMVIGLAHCLAVNGRTIPALVDYLEAMLKRPGGDPEGGPMDVDGAYSWFRGRAPTSVTLIADPQIALQRASPSDITRAWFDRVPGLAQLAAAARRLRRAVR